jgi:hypothetical protein
MLLRSLRMSLITTALVLLPIIGSLPPHADAQSDWDAVSDVVGRKGELNQAGVYRVSFPRSDLKVSVSGTPIKTGLALGGWAAFRNEGTATVVDGDFALLPSEIDPVVTVLQSNSLTVTALHNHLAGETPEVMYLHFLGIGDAIALARGIRAAIAETATPPPASSVGPTAEVPDWARALQQSFGHSGTIKGGVLSIGVPRPEGIHADGAMLLPSMGMAHAFNFQEVDGGRVATTGDFVLTDDEVNPVLRQLRAGGLGVTAIHNHLLHGMPSLIFMHFWGVGTPSQVGDALRQALAQAKTQHAKDR